MCLIAFAWNEHPDYRLILAANRVIVLCDHFAVEIVLGVVGGHRDRGGIGLLLLGELCRAGLAAFELDLAEEGLALGAFTPRRLGVFRGNA